MIYLNLQKVMELLARGREGLRSAELKVPELVLGSERERDQTKIGSLGSTF